MSSSPTPRSRRLALLDAAIRRRILILDGAYGTELQRLRLGEADFRGERFRDWPTDLRGNNDLLTLTRPDAVRGVHESYLAAGADFIETNTFSSTTIAQADYGLEAIVPELNEAGARLARAACDAFEARDGRPRWVIGILGPTNRSASLSPRVDDPGFRNVTFEELVTAYHEAAAALLRGGADVLMIETIFDTLNAKAALFATEQLFDELGERVPVMISATITDASGRVLLGANGKPMTQAGTALEISKRTYLERRAHVAKEYLRIFPRLNASYNLTANLVLRAAYYDSLGRPNYNQYAGGITLPDLEAAPSPSNRITLSNTSIKPWTAHTGKVAIEYYFESTGLVSLGATDRAAPPIVDRSSIRA